MGMMGKLMFWKKEPESGSLDKGFEDLNAGTGFGGKETGFGMGRDDMGLRRDPTAGLAGTGDLSGGGFEKDVNLRGPGFEHVEEPTPLKSAPLERKQVYYQEVGPSAQQGQGYGQYQQPYQRDIGKDLEVISAKLDSIKSMLDMINHRVDAIERQQSRKGRMEW